VSVPAGEALRFHERTKHSVESVRRVGHRLDWDNRPNPFKEYRGLEALPLPGELPRYDTPALDALAGPGAERRAAELRLPDLARLLRWGAGVVRARRLAGGETYHFRTYPSAGALYPVEVYIACAELPGLAGGLYHFHPGELALRRLRAGDARPALAALADAPELTETGAVLVLTGIIWRSAWKYRARAYRHLYWDAGTMLANLLALAASAGLRARLLTGFVDAEANHLVGVDGEREATLALLAVGHGQPAAAESALPSHALEAVSATSPPVSAHEVAHPEAAALHRASALATDKDVRAYRAPAPPVAVARASAARSPDPLEVVIGRRGSARDYALAAVPVAELEAILKRATGAVPADTPPLTEPYVIAHAVDGLDPGSYRFADGGCFELQRRGEFRARAGFLCLEQPLGARASATIFLMANLEHAVAALGDRGYRAAQLEAGVRAGRIVLGAYAQGLGATPLTFYDDAVAEFFAAGKGPMLCVTVGIDRLRPRLRERR
jgi:SagB-type dehydrogenase family enzyme